MHILWVIIIGFVAGLIARLLAPGSNNPAGFILTTLLGIAGAFVATFIGQAIGWYRADQGAGLIGAIVGALVVLFVWHRLVSARYPGPRRPPLALDCTTARRGFRSTTTERDPPARPAIVNRLSSRDRRIFSTARRASAAETGIKEVTISTWASSSSVSPCAASAASSMVGGSRRTRRRPSLVFHTSLIPHLCPAEPRSR